VSESNNTFENELAKIQLNLYNFIKSKVYAHHDAQDIVQKTNLIICSKRDSYRKGELQQWSNRIAEFQIKAFFTNHKRNKVFCCENIPDNVSSCISYNSNNSKDYAAKYKILLSAIESLPKSMKYIAYLRFVKSLPLKEICKHSGRSIGAVTSTINRAKKALSNIVLEEYDKHEQI
jgi:RNA polymerase sigma factor (sigma-70 family)